MHPHAVFAGKAGHETLGQQQDVLARSRSGATQMGTTLRRKKRSWRNSLRSTLSSRRRLVVAMTRTSTLMVRLPPTRSNSRSWRTRSSLACKAGEDLADFVQQDRAGVRQFEAPFPLGDRAGERALFVPEKLALDEVLRNGGAIDADERRLRAGAFAVNRPRDQFLAGAALALDEDRRLRAGHLADQVPQLLHRLAAPSSS